MARLVPRAAPPSVGQVPVSASFVRADALDLVHFLEVLRAGVAEPGIIIISPLKPTAAQRSDAETFANIVALRMSKIF